MESARSVLTMDRAKALCEELKKAGINHIVWLPDSETHFMHDAILTDPEIKVIQVCREGEAIAICAGLHLGGKRGAVLIENQGLFDSGNELKWAIGLNMPMLLLVGYLGYQYLQNPPPAGSGHLFQGKRKDYTEPFLSAFDLKYYLVDSNEDVNLVASACEEAWQSGRPVALLLTSADKYVPGT